MNFNGSFHCKVAQQKHTRPQERNCANEVGRPVRSTPQQFHYSKKLINYRSIFSNYFLQTNILLAQMRNKLDNVDMCIYGFVMCDCFENCVGVLRNKQQSRYRSGGAQRFPGS